MSVPNTFSGATSAIPLSNLDANFAYYDDAFQVSGGAMAVNYTFRIKAPADNTRVVELLASTVSTGTTRQFTFPDASGTIALTSGTQTFSGTTTFNGACTFSGSATFNGVFSATNATGTFGSSTAAATYGLGSGATTAAATKTINIGTSGVSTSVTNINYGSAVTGAVVTHIWNAGANNMRMDSNGNFLLGTSSVSNSPAQGVQLTNNTSIGAVFVGHANGTATGNYFSAFSYNAGIIGSITQNGISAVLYNTTSDYRLKTVVGAVSGSGSRIDALEPVEYEWKTDGTRTRGFLAHKFQEVYPSSVTGTKDAVDLDNKPIYQAMQASSAEVIADLVVEIQALRKRVAALEKE